MNNVIIILSLTFLLGEENYHQVNGQLDPTNQWEYPSVKTLPKDYYDDLSRRTMPCQDKEIKADTRLQSPVIDLDREILTNYMKAARQHIEEEAAIDDSQKPLKMVEYEPKPVHKISNTISNKHNSRHHDQIPNISKSKRHDSSEESNSEVSVVETPNTDKINHYSYTPSLFETSIHQPIHISTIQPEYEYKPMKITNKPHTIVHSQNNVDNSEQVPSSHTRKSMYDVEDSVDSFSPLQNDLKCDQNSVDDIGTSRRSLDQHQGRKRQKDSKDAEEADIQIRKEKPNKALLPIENAQEIVSRSNFEEQNYLTPSNGMLISDIRGPKTMLLESTILCYACSSLSDSTCWNPDKQTTVKYCKRGNDSCLVKTYKPSRKAEKVVVRDCGNTCNPDAGIKFDSCDICTNDLCNKKPVKNGATTNYTYDIIGIIFTTILIKASTLIFN